MIYLFACVYSSNTKYNYVSICVLVFWSYLLWAFISFNLRFFKFFPRMWQIVHSAPNSVGGCVHIFSIYWCVWAIFDIRFELSCQVALRWQFNFFLYFAKLVLVTNCTHSLWQGSRVELALLGVRRNSIDENSVWNTTAANGSSIWLDANHTVSNKYLRQQVDERFCGEIGFSLIFLRLQWRLVKVVKLVSV